LRELLALKPAKTVRFSIERGTVDIAVVRQGFTSENWNVEVAVETT
jgi:hypothetical protein